MAETTQLSSRDRAVLSIFRDLRACERRGGRLLFEDIEAAWLERDEDRDELILSLQQLVDDGLLELQEVGRDSVFSITEAGYQRARALWDPVRTISGLAGFLIRRAQQQQESDVKRRVGKMQA